MHNYSLLYKHVCVFVYTCFIYCETYWKIVCKDHNVIMIYLLG